MKKFKDYMKAIMIILCIAALVAFIAGVVLLFVEEPYPIWAWFHGIGNKTDGIFITSLILAAIGTMLSFFLNRH